MSKDELFDTLKARGNFGHAGRPGKRGGSLSKGGVSSMSVELQKDLINVLGSDMKKVNYAADMDQTDRDKIYQAQKIISTHTGVEQHWVADAWRNNDSVAKVVKIVQTEANDRAQYKKEEQARLGAMSEAERQAESKTRKKLERESGNPYDYHQLSAQELRSEMRSKPKKK